MFSDYDRFFYLLKRADDLHIEIKQKEIRAIGEFFATVDTLFENLFVLFPDTVSEELEKLLDSMEERVDAVYSLLQENRLEEFKDIAIFKDLSRLYRYLLIQKQWCGLGIVRKRDYPAKHRLARAMDIVKEEGIDHE
jgi:hypothetical protein